MMRWLSFLFCCFLFLVFAQRALAETSASIRAIFPNPLGSDSTEWILIENTGEGTIGAGSLLLQDVEGSIKTYSIQKDILEKEFLFISATESGIALNNAQDAVEVFFQGEKVSESFVYTDAQDDQVWWQSEDGEWQWEEKSSFLQRFENGDFSLASVEAQIKATPSSSPEDLVSEELDASEHISEGLASPRVSAEIYPGKEHTLLSTETPRLLQGKKRLSDIEFPEFDFEGETARFVAWKKQALQGSLGLIAGGMFWLIVCFPYWWQKYRWRF